MPTAHIRQTIDTLGAARDGVLEAHIWRGTPSQLMHIVYVEPGTPVDPDPSVHGLDKAFASACQVTYGGVMQEAELTQRIEDLTHGAEQLNI